MTGMDAEQPLPPPPGGSEPYYTTWPWPGQSVRLSPVQPEPTADQVGRREIRDLEALVADTEHRWAVGLNTPSDFDKGVHAVFLWALGRARAPFTQVGGPPDLAALLAEDDAAYAEVYSRDRRVKQAYAVGAQHAAMWLRGKTQDAPWSI